jgi:hypothetical protein
MNNKKAEVKRGQGEQERQRKQRRQGEQFATQNFYADR